MNVEQLIAFIIPNARLWIEEQRGIHRPDGRSVFSEEKKILEQFFRTETLEKVRIKFVPQIENPPFFVELMRRGYPMPPDFSQMAGITFDETILISQSDSKSQSFMSLLFHELVHVVQYSLLGVSEFTKRYVLGWVQNGYNYSSIPFERDAYELQARFYLTNDQVFSVEDIVRERLKIN